VNENEKLFRAVGDVGGDLIHMAEAKTFAASPWRRWGALAACLALVACLGFAALPKMQTKESAPESAAAPTATEFKKEASTNGTADLFESQLDEAPAENRKEYAVEEESAPAPVTEEGEALGNPKAIHALGWVSFRGTVYYGWEFCQEESVLPVISGRADSVTTGSDQVDWVGRAVFETFSSTIVDAASASTDADGIPSEIFVETKNGMLRCTTFYQPSDAFITRRNAIDMLDNQAEDALLETFVRRFEMNFSDQPFSSAAELNAAQLQTMYLLLLQTERQFGTRTYEADQAAWFDENEQVFVIPLSDVCRTLSTYLDGYTLNASQMPGYDQQRNALVLSDIRTDLEESAWPYRLQLLDASFMEDDTLVLSVGCYTEDYKTQTHINHYVIRFEAGCCYFDSIEPELPVGVSDEAEAEKPVEKP